MNRLNRLNRSNSKSHFYNSSTIGSTITTSMNSMDSTVTSDPIRSPAFSIVSHPILSPNDHQPISPIAHPPVIPNSTYLTDFFPKGITLVVLPRKRPQIN